MAPFPFAYLNHGELGVECFGPAASLWIGFAEPLTAKRLQWMVDTCPEPLAGLFYADDALFHCQTAGPETFTSAVSRLHGDDTSVVPLPTSRAFAKALDHWSRDVHELTRIAFFCGPGTARHGYFDRQRFNTPRSPAVFLSRWASWSARRMPSVIDWIEEYLDTHEDMPPTEGDAVPGWPARPMDRLTLSFIVDSIPDGNDSVYNESDDLRMGERVDALRARLEYRRP